jgi:hypothetical protein
MQTGKRSSGIPVALLVERFSPIVLSLLCVAFIGLFKGVILTEISRSGVNLANLYSSVFNWSAIHVGFAFGVYGFLLSKSDGFIGEVRKTVAMARFISYVRRGAVGGFALTLVSVPITVVSPDPASSTFSFWAVSLWFGLFVWTFLAFVRIAFNFIRLTTVPEQEPFYGA